MEVGETKDECFVSPQKEVLGGTPKGGQVAELQQVGQQAGWGGLKDVSCSQRQACHLKRLRGTPLPLHRSKS